MDEKRRELLDRMVRRVVETVSPDEVVLFGSWARGEDRPDSDVDRLVVERDNFSASRSRRAEMTRIWRALAPFGVPVDVVLFSQEEIARYRDGANHIVARALREGRVLYERR